MRRGRRRAVSGPPLSSSQASSAVRTSSRHSTLSQGNRTEAGECSPRAAVSSRSVAARPLREVVDAGWADALEPVGERIAAMGDFLRAEIAAGRAYLPAGRNVLRAFQQPFEGVRVLIVGQDPYPTPGHAVGLSFSVAPDVR